MPRGIPAKTRSVREDAIGAFASSFSAITPARDPRAFTLTDSTCMNERRRPPRRGRGPRTARPAAEQGEPNPYRDGPGEAIDAPVERAPRSSEPATPAAPPPASPPPPPPAPAAAQMEPAGSAESAPVAASAAAPPASAPNPRLDNGGYTPPREGGGFQERQNGRRGRRNRGRGRREQGQGTPAGRAPARHRAAGAARRDGRDDRVVRSRARRRLRAPRAGELPRRRGRRLRRRPFWSGSTACERAT